MLPKQEELASVWLVKISACGRPFCVLSDSLHDGCKFCDNNECHTEFCLPCITAFALHQTLVSTGLACLHVFEKCWNYGSMNFSFLHFWQNLWLRDWFVKWICFYFPRSWMPPSKIQDRLPSLSRWWLLPLKLPRLSTLRCVQVVITVLEVTKVVSHIPPRWLWLPPSKLPK